MREVTSARNIDFRTAFGINFRMIILCFICICNCSLYAHLCKRISSSLYEIISKGYVKVFLKGILSALSTS